jgi:purine-binding chemotaxis protein CheW
VNGLEELVEVDAVSLCLLRVGDGFYGIDTREVREVLAKTRPQRVPLAPHYIAGVVPYRGEVLTTVCLRVLLGLDASLLPSHVVVIEDMESGERFGIAVDAMRGVATVDPQSMEANPSTLDARSAALFVGAYRVGDELMVQLDPHRMRSSRLDESGLFALEAEITGVEGCGH